MWSIVMILSILLGCQNYGIIAADDNPSDDTGADTQIEEDFSEWDGAWLEVITPQSGDFLAWDQESSFQAVVYLADGTEADFQDVQWSSSEDEGWLVREEDACGEDTMLYCGCA